MFIGIDTKRYFLSKDASPDFKRGYWSGAIFVAFITVLAMLAYNVGYDVGKDHAIKDNEIASDSDEAELLTD